MGHPQLFPITRHRASWKQAWLIYSPEDWGCHHQLLGWGLLCCGLVCLTWPIILDSHEVSLFESPRLISLPYMSCPWTCATCLPHCLIVCVPTSLSHRLLYLFLRLQAQPRSIICLEDALGSEWVWRGQCCWELSFGGSWLERMCVKLFGFLNIICGISQIPQMVMISEKSLSWSRQLKLLSFPQVSNPRDPEWKGAEFRTKVSKLFLFEQPCDLIIQIFSVDCQRIFRRKKGRLSKFAEDLKKIWGNGNNYVHQSWAGAGMGEGKKGMEGWLFSPNSAGLGHRRPVWEVCLFLQSAFAVWPWVHITCPLWALLSYW